MTSQPETRDSLLLQVRDARNHEAWLQFEALYRPLVYRLARGRGLQAADADDVTQKVLLSVARALPEWERQSPETRFRHWLRRVAHHAILNALTRGPKEPAVGGTDFLARQQGVAERRDVLQARIEEEYRRQIFRRAADEVRQSVNAPTWQMFERTAVHGETTEAVADSMGTTVGNVHAARSRIMRRLKQIAREIQETEP